MKKLLTILILITIICIGTISYAEEDIEIEFSEEELENEIEQAVARINEVPTINSRAAIIMDRITGVVIYEKNGTQVRKMASTTNVISYQR